jgi:hypothetical protein
MTEFDYLVVGGVPPGCIVAARLVPPGFPTAAGVAPQPAQCDIEPVITGTLSHRAGNLSPAAIPLASPFTTASACPPTRGYGALAPVSDGGKGSPHPRRACLCVP